MVRDRFKRYGIRVVDGIIRTTTWDDIETDLVQHHAVNIAHRVLQLFTLPRPQVCFSPMTNPNQHGAGINPGEVVINGLLARQDLFKPAVFAQRIPVDTLRLNIDQQGAVQRLPLSDEELAFLSRLYIPTPVPIILWKRGLNPRHASALIVALNLLGAFDEVWAPGDLPRLTAANIRPPIPKVNTAYGRIASSRRSRAVISSEAQPIARIRLEKRRVDPWVPWLGKARRASARQEHSRAQAFAVKALAHSPPKGIKAELLRILTRAA